jgi:predicted metal-binding membrane protein
MNGVGMGSRFAVGSLLFFVLVWVLMMAAMIFPSVGRVPNRR